MFEKLCLGYERPFKCTGGTKHFIEMSTIWSPSLTFLLLCLPMIVFGKFDIISNVIRIKNKSAL